MTGRRRKGLLVALASLVVALLCVEGALRVWPRLLPASLRDRLPWHGVELFRPGVLSETPLDAVPLPLVFDPLDGTLPADLVDKGIAPRGLDVDRRLSPRTRIPVDALGMPNTEVPESADVVLVGDSFLVAAAAVEPPSLSRLLAERLNARVYALGHGGLGPFEEAWLVREVGMKLHPRLVLWLYYGGNDLLDAASHLRRVERGFRNQAEVDAYVVPPRSRLLGLIATALETPRPAGETLPPFVLPAQAGETRQVWFLPGNLVMAATPRRLIEEQPAWTETWAVIARTRHLVEEGGARFALVYLPSKVQALLPYVEPDPELVARYFTWGGGDVRRTPEELLAQLLDRRDDLEDLLRERCDEEEIPFLSATPYLEAQAARGELGYLTLDTHWWVTGQLAILGPLVDLSEALLGE